MPLTAGPESGAFRDSLAETDEGAGCKVQLSFKKKEENIPQWTPLNGYMTMLSAIIVDMKPLINVTDFKARCLALLDEMEQQGEPITITRRGHPVAVLSPAPKNAWKSPANSWNGKAEVVGDIVNADSSALWEVASAK